MRRQDREITNDAAKIAILDECTVCRLGLSDHGAPYVVPLNYGYSYTNGRLELYFHGAKTGRKLDIMKENNRACVEVDSGHELISGGENPCKYGYAFRSLICFGEVEMIEDKTEKAAALNFLMKRQTGQDRTWQFDERMLESVAVYKLVVDEWTGKEHEAPSPAA
jgi:nitroimidazol reductase NimA-like FMN-containing flavoprotein (pyridoxamine 5'-phosphate oxidase superfamily)